jgi:hypothetical protein
MVAKAARKVLSQTSILASNWAERASLVEVADAGDAGFVRKRSLFAVASP